MADLPNSVGLGLLATESNTANLQQLRGNLDRKHIYKQLLIKVISKNSFQEWPSCWYLGGALDPINAILVETC